MTIHSKSWHRRDGLASWNFDVPALQDESPEACLRRTLVSLVEGMPGFARLAYGGVATREHGDKDDHFARQPTLADVLAICDGPDHVVDLVFGLDLEIVEAVGAAPSWADRAGALTISTDDFSPANPVVTVYLGLDIDIYARDAGEDAADNRPLSRLNGPRLARFLAVLNGPLKARLVEVASDGYRADGEVDEHGFKYE